MDTVQPESGAVGVTSFDGADAGPVPWAFVAVTVNVVAVSLVSPWIGRSFVLPEM